MENFLHHVDMLNLQYSLEMELGLDEQIYGFFMNTIYSFYPEKLKIYNKIYMSED